MSVWVCASCISTTKNVRKMQFHGLFARQHASFSPRWSEARWPAIFHSSSELLTPIWGKLFFLSPRVMFFPCRPTLLRGPQVIFHGPNIQNFPRVPLLSGYSSFLSPVSTSVPFFRANFRSPFSGDRRVKSK